MDTSTPLIWLDLETTGLDSMQHHIVEVAVVVTDQDLRELESWSAVVAQPEETLQASEVWPLEQHTASGLYEACQERGMPLAEVERQVLALLQRHAAKGQGWLAGANPGFDAAFLHRHMPKVYGWLHHRTLDVYGVARIFGLWNAAVYEGAPGRKKPHRAMADVRETIQLMDHYRKAVLPRRPAVVRRELPNGLALRLIGHDEDLLPVA